MSKKKKAAKPQHAIVVLGMHRSGTSALAGVLARLGCDLPAAIMPANAFNPKGFYESLKVYNMNDAILASGGSRWDDWQAFNPDWIKSPKLDEFLDRGAEVLSEEYGKSRLFVLKDPRICRLMPFWKRLFQQQGIQPVYVLTHRNPLEVAGSLQEREGWPLAAGLLLWLRHVLDAEAESRGTVRCFTSYDRVLAGWAGVVSKIQSRVQLHFPRFSSSVGAEIDGFLSNDLRHRVTSTEALADSPLISKWVRSAFETLERWADHGELEADYALLDQIREEFEVSAPMFGDLINAMQARITQGDAELQAQKTAAESRGAELAALSAQLDQTVEQVTTLRIDLGAQQEEAAALRQVAEKKQQETAQLSARLEESNCSLHERAQQLQELQETLESVEQERWQIRSTLEQRSQEAEDMGRANTENAAQVKVLQAQLEAQRAEQKGIKAERDQSRKSVRLMRLKLQEEFDVKLKDVLTSQRRHADARSAELDAQLQKLTAALAEARALEQHRNEERQHLIADRDRSVSEREEQAEVIGHLHHRIGELEQMAEAYANSTSWKITGPLRRLVTMLRR